MATTLPTSDQHDVVLQGPDGSVDFLQFRGTTLVGSVLEQYGLGTFRVVANGDFNNDGHPDIVAQDPGTGQIDILFLDAHANMIGSALGDVLPTIRAAGFFGNNVPAAAAGSPNLIGQLPDGSIDILAVNSAGHLVASNLLAGTSGSGMIVGTANADGGFFGPGFKAVGQDVLSLTPPGTDDIVTQLPDGTIDVLGFAGSFAGGTLHLSASFLVPGTAGGPTVAVMDQDQGGRTDADLTNGANGQRAVEAVGLTSSGQIDLSFFDAGYGENQAAGNGNAGQFEGTTIGTLAENFSLSIGWQIVDAGLVVHNDLFPLT